MQWTGRYALIGGAAGGGKSQLLLFDPFRQIKIETERRNSGEIRESTGRALFFRRTMPELREVMDRARRVFKTIDPAAEWHEATKTWTFGCGYKYMFGQMEEAGDWLKYYGFELSWLGFDELTTFTEEQFDQMDTRVRSADPVLKDMLYVRAGTNPVGPGLEWVRRRFVEIAPPGTPVEVHVKVKTTINGVEKMQTVKRRQIFIPAKVSDNPSIDQAEYAATLSTKSEAVKRALLHGDWYVTEGAFLTGIWDPSVHICEPFKIPNGWYKFRCGDYGHSWPGKSSIQWVAVDTDQNYVVYRSLTVTGHDSEMLGYRIRELELENDEWDLARNCSKLTGPLDSSCWAVTGHRGPTIAEIMMNIGIHWQKSEKDRHSMCDQLRIRLRRRTGHPTVKDEYGRAAMIVPGIRWFSKCWSYVRDPRGRKVKTGPTVTLPILPADENDPDVFDTKADDHDADAIGYGCLYRPLRPDSDTLPQKYWDDDDDDVRKAPSRNIRAGYPGLVR